MTDEEVKNMDWTEVLSMDPNVILQSLRFEYLRGLSNKELCKLFKFLSCFFCCLDKEHCDCDRG